MGFPDKRAGLGILLLVAVVLGLLVLSKDPPQPTITGPTDVYTVNDETTGISFNMSKNFQPIPRDELTKLSPIFNYGYRSANDSKANCFIVQTKLKEGARPTPQGAVEGLMVEIKKVHPDATLNNEGRASNPVVFGDATGVLLDLNYREDHAEYRRVEAMAVGQTNQVIAYCESLASDNSKYYNDFTILFSSLKLTN